MTLAQTQNDSGLRKESDIFKNVFRQLIKEGKNPGKISLLLLKDEGRYKVVGAFTENQGGSLSFFPDFSDKLVVKHLKKHGQMKKEGADPFGHITLNSDFSKRGHLTDPETRKKSILHDPQKLSEGVYHWFSIILASRSALNYLVPVEEVKPLTIQHVALDLNPDWGMNAIKGHIVREFAEELTPDNFGCIEVQLLKKGLPHPKVLAESMFRTEMCGFPILPEKISMNTNVYVTENNFGYDIRINLFNVKAGKPINNVLIIFPTLNILNPGL